MKVLFGVLLTIIFLIGAGLILIYSGAYNVAATSADGPVLGWVLSTAQERSIRAHAGDTLVTAPSDSATFTRGFQAYEAMCVVCHGAPGIDRGWMGQGMNPQPPELGEEAQPFTRSELYWILSNGIKLAGMPALSPSHSEAEILELVAFVDRLPEISPDEYQRLRNAQSQARTDSTAGDGHSGHAH